MNKKLFAIPLLIIAVVFLYSCKGGKSGVSSTTGWNYNDPKNGGFEVAEGVEQETGPGLVFIEGGTFTMGRTEQDVFFDWNNVPRRVTVESFYMDETEVKNIDYREYLYWVSRVFSDYPEVYKKALPDTLCWRDKMAYNEPYVEYYFRHPSYNEYPVVGVNWLQATDYCKWRSDRVNENILIQQGILDWDPNQKGDNNFNTDAYLAGQYQGVVKKNLPSMDPNKEDRPVRFDDGLLLPQYRLPTEAEWEYAALGLIGNTYEERMYEKRIYPWNGHGTRNDSRKNLGQFRANNMRGRGDNMGLASNLNDNASITAPVKSFWPNDYNLYCMAGNVNEWVLDIYRPLSSEDVNEFRPFRGNVFMTKELDADGNLAQKDSLGHLRWRPVKDEEAHGRINYKKSDYRDYKDGDLESSIYYASDDDKLKQNANERMYTQSEDPDDGNPAVWSSLINNRSRVYKGGSWKDRTYWLAPGARRFLDEASSRDDLGFRCAMDRVGSPTGR